MRAAWGQLNRADVMARAARPRGSVAMAAIAAVALVAIVTLLEPTAALWVLAGLAACALAVRQPHVLCYLLAPAVALSSLAPVQVGPLRAGPTDLIVGALAVGALVRAWPALAQTRVTARGMWATLRAWRRREPMAAALTLALAAYLLVIAASLAVASSRALTLKELLKWGEALVVFVVGVRLLREPARRAPLVWTAIAVGVGEALLGYGQWVAAAGDLGVNGSGIRVFGTFDQPNPFAAYLNLTLPIALALALFGRPARTRWLAGGAAAVMLGAQALANSRGGLLALGAAIVVVVLVGLGVERLAILAGGVVAVAGGLAWAAGVLPHSIQDRILRLVRANGVSLSGPVNDASYSSVSRLAHWVAGVRMFLAHPILGVGAGNYGVAYPRYAEPTWHASLLHAHNYYINAAAETGALGLAAFVALTGTILYAGWRAARRGVAAEPAAARSAGGSPSASRSARWRRFVATGAPLAAIRDGSWSRAVALGLLGVFVTVAVHNVVDDLFVHAMELQMALSLALVVALARAPLAPEGASVAPRLAGEAIGDEDSSPHPLE